MDSGKVKLLEQVREHYAAAARAVATGQAYCCGCEAGGVETAAVGAEATACATGRKEVSRAEAWGGGLYEAGDRIGLPTEALAASLGCGNPLAVADLAPGERVLDLGSGGGIDVILSARRVGTSGFVFGVDMTEEMLELARANAAKAGVANVEFRKGTIEAVPLPGSSVDVVISNCVINLSVDKDAVLAEMFRVLRPGGRIGISDVVVDDHVARAERGTYVGCTAGALSRREYLDGLAGAGFVGASVRFTHEAMPGVHAAIIRATKPATTYRADSDAGREPI